MTNEKGPDMDDAGDIYRLDELLGAYALDAVDEIDRRRVDDYLRINPKASAEVQAHRDVATMLAFTGMDAPADLWDKITAEIEADAPEMGPELAKVLGVDDRSDVFVRGPIATSDAPVEHLDARRTRPSVASWVLGAAAAIAIVVAGAVVLLLGDASSNDPIADAYELAIADDDSVRADLVAEGVTGAAFGVVDREGHGFLDAATLPTLASDQTYQLWGVLESSGDVVSIGILGPDPELETFTVDGQVSALAITIEQAPGVISDGNPQGAYVGALS